MAPILIHPDLSRPIFLESDASNYALEQIYFKMERTNDFTLLHFIHGSSQLQRSIMRFMIKNL
jgi:hypothetical protein